MGSGEYEAGVINYIIKNKQGFGVPKALLVFLSVIKLRVALREFLLRGTVLRLNNRYSCGQYWLA